MPSASGRRTPSAVKPTASRRGTSASPAGAVNILHNTSHAVAGGAEILVHEHLAVANLLNNAKLAFGLPDAALGELHRQIDFKAERLGGLALWAPRFETLLGDVMAELDLSGREWNCASRGVSHDRGGNAATNLLWLAELRRRRTGRRRSPPLGPWKRGR
jgi:transposase